MKLGGFGVAVAPFGLGFSPSESKWVQDPKKPGFGVPGVTWGSNRAIFTFPGHFAPTPGPIIPITPLWDVPIPYSWVGGMGAALSIREPKGLWRDQRGTITGGTFPTIIGHFCLAITEGLS